MIARERRSAEVQYNQSVINALTWPAVPEMNAQQSGGSSHFHCFINVNRYQPGYACFMHGHSE